MNTLQVQHKLDNQWTLFRHQNIKLSIMTCKLVLWRYPWIQVCCIFHHPYYFHIVFYLEHEFLIRQVVSIYCMTYRGTKEMESDSLITMVQCRTKTQTNSSEWSSLEWRGSLLISNIKFSTYLCNFLFPSQTMKVTHQQQKLFWWDLMVLKIQFFSLFPFFYQNQCHI